MYNYIYIYTYDNTASRTTSFGICTCKRFIAEAPEWCQLDKLRCMILSVIDFGRCWYRLSRRSWISSSLQMWFKLIDSLSTRQILTTELQVAVGPSERAIPQKRAPETTIYQYHRVPSSTTRTLWSTHCCDVTNVTSCRQVARHYPAGVVLPVRDVVFSTPGSARSWLYWPDDSCTGLQRMTDATTFPKFISNGRPRKLRLCSRIIFW